MKEDTLLLLKERIAQSKTSGQLIQHAGEYLLEAQKQKIDRLDLRICFGTSRSFDRSFLSDVLPHNEELVLELASALDERQPETHFLGTCEEHGVFVVAIRMFGITKDSAKKFGALGLRLRLASVEEYKSVKQR